MGDAPTPASYNFADLWEAIWPRVADRLALVCGDQERTYTQLAERANRLAHHLRERGVGPGDTVALFLRNDTAYLEAMIAPSRCGRSVASTTATPATLDTSWPTRRSCWSGSPARWPAGRSGDRRRAPAVSAMRSILVVADPGSDGGLVISAIWPAMPYGPRWPPPRRADRHRGRSGDDT
jgi:non-ribosomal peptide synthetase component F